LHSSQPKDTSVTGDWEQKVASTNSSSTKAQNSEDGNATMSTIVFNDGSKKELHDFAFYSFYISPKSYYTDIKRSTDTELRLKMGSFWRFIDPTQIKVLEGQPNQDRNQVWLEVNLQLSSGEQMSGQLPKIGGVTWLQCNGFEFGGKTSILGTVGDFTIDIRELQSIVAQGTPELYEIKDTSGKVTVVKGLTYEKYVQPPTYSIIRYKFFGRSFEVTVENIKVDLNLEKIESITFPDKLVGKIHFRMRTGEEADGSFSGDKQIDLGFGRTTDGLIWFQKLADYETQTYVIKSIAFGPLKQD